jgi:NifB/MoaA-like Fe-S oxidoreductase
MALAKRKFWQRNIRKLFAQYENGFGNVAKFMKECYDAIDCVNLPKKPHGVVVLTGISAQPIRLKIMKKLYDKTGQSVTVACIENDYFGKSITVEGLNCGGDIVNQLQGKCQGEIVIILGVMLRD